MNSDKYNIMLWKSSSQCVYCMQNTMPMIITITAVNVVGPFLLKPYFDIHNGTWQGNLINAMNPYVIFIQIGLLLFTIHLIAFIATLLGSKSIYFPLFFCIPFVALLPTFKLLTFNLQPFLFLPILIYFCSR